MTLVKILDMHLSTREFSISVFFFFQAKQSIRIGLFHFVFTYKKCKQWNLLISLHVLYKGMAKKTNTLPCITIFWKLYFGLLNLRSCGSKFALILVLWSGHLFSCFHGNHMFAMQNINIFSQKIITILICGSNDTCIGHTPSFFQTTTLCSHFFIMHYIKTVIERQFGGSLLLTWVRTHKCTNRNHTS